MSSLTYADAGVNIEAGNTLVERIKPLAKATTRTGVAGGLGGFGGLFDLKACGYNDPILVSCTDGVGTKLKIAQQLDKHDTIGIDLVAMCVNDLIVQGAEPLFFLDYFATGKLSVDVAEAVVKGIADGCKESGCALLGGETAEMPGMYADGEYDLAGFAVGVVEREQLLPRKDIQAGDVLLGLASSGIHSNGYSLVRKLMERANLTAKDDQPCTPGSSIGEILLRPTKLYVKSCLQAVRTGKVKGLAHITGGGLTENIPRVLPEGVHARIHLDRWERAGMFEWAKKTGNLDDAELLRTFNCGIGMVVVVAPEEAEAITQLLSNAGETVYNLGELFAADGAASVEYV